MTKRRVYLDHSATTPVDPRVANAMARAVVDTFGNASSVHGFGQQARAAMDRARLLSKTMNTGRVAERFHHCARHLVRDARVDRRGGAVIQVNSAFRHQITPKVANSDAESGI